MEINYENYVNENTGISIENERIPEGTLEKYIENRKSLDGEIRNFDFVTQMMVIEYADKTTAITKLNNLFEKLKKENRLEKLEEEARRAIKEEVYNDEENLDSRDKLWNDKPEEFMSLLKKYRSPANIEERNKIKGFLNDAQKNNPIRFIYELIQNADDCIFSPDNKDNSFSIEFGPDTIKTYCNEKGMTVSNILAITAIKESDKILQRKQRKVNLIGEKGSGFKSVFGLFERASIYSNGFNFVLKEDYSIGEPDSINIESSCGTTMVFDGINNNSSKIKFKEAVECYGVKFNDQSIELDNENILHKCPLFFTNNLIELKLTDAETNKTITIKKDITEDEVKISYD